MSEQVNQIRMIKNLSVELILALDNLDLNPMKCQIKIIIITITISTALRIFCGRVVGLDSSVWFLVIDHSLFNIFGLYKRFIFRQTFLKKKFTATPFYFFYFLEFFISSLQRSKTLVYTLK